MLSLECFDPLILDILCFRQISPQSVCMLAACLLNSTIMLALDMSLRSLATGVHTLFNGMK